ncbi:hypothetical protein GE061_019193 [Apolygus lucorum]|uniref:Uncharacterized protein n=1 Tax=Apolygus lucorum TaxID=248454 RepID=A0A6A4JJH9_APOLU|nr:hypothetical protein GE061_019193 [Apolygus lucorum]
MNRCRMCSFSAKKLVMTLILVTINSCLGSWRECKRTDQPCIQFEKKLCVCTPFWDPIKKHRVFMYICETAPYDMPKWVRETWRCPVPGIGNPIGKVWLPYLDPALKGLVKMSSSNNQDEEPR